MGPLSSVTRIAENAGAVVMRVSGLAPEIDAISFATKRPLIALNGDGRSACRERFGIAHELGHFSLHIGVLTGDRLTETQANRFASALLLPRSTFATECRMALRGTRLNWAGLSELKMRWGLSKAAIIFRARQLGLFTEEQARAGYLGLNRHGEALREIEDHLIPSEEPEVIVESLKVMRKHFGVPEAAVAREMRVQPQLLQTLLGRFHAESSANVVRLASPRSAACRSSLPASSRARLGVADDRWYVHNPAVDGLKTSRSGIIFFSRLRNRTCRGISTWVESESDIPWMLRGR